MAKAIPNKNIKKVSLKVKTTKKLIKKTIAKKNIS